MARNHSAEEVLDIIDEDNEFDEPHEVILDGSDEEFTDLEDIECENGYSTTQVVSSSYRDHTQNSICSEDSHGAELPADLVPPESSPSSLVSNVLTPWSRCLSIPYIHRFQPYSQIGPTCAIPKEPGDIFQLFFTPDLVQDRASKSNIYAKQVMGAEKYNKWQQITANDVEAFLGFNFLMGLNPKPSLNDYWSNNDVYYYSPVAQRISRDRFGEISRYLHFADNSSLSSPGSPTYDRLGKVRPVLEYLQEKFQTLYNPSKNLCVDEAMIKFKGRSSLKQYMPMKPIKRGIKVWVLGDSANGYFSRLKIYTGKKGNEVEKGLGAKVVKELTKDFQGRWHNVYFDNFFTSKSLLCDLEEVKIYGCGTARSDRRHFPEGLREIKLETRGDSCTFQADNVCATAWRDCKVFTVMYSGFDPDEKTTVLRTQRNGSRLSIPCPAAIAAYNSYMGGVDHGDQLRGYYSYKMKSRKFYKYIFNFLVGVALTNSFCAL